VYETVPVPGDNAITSLMTCPDGLILGFAGAHLYILDPKSRGVVYADKKFNVATYAGALWKYEP
jgi:hypothetical protein